MGIPHPTNHPGGRYSHSSVMDDDSGLLFVFGGSPKINVLNDLWIYDPILNVWTWIAGTSEVNQPEQKSNLPSVSLSIGSRCGASMILKRDERALYLFGGYGFVKTVGGLLNDLWKIPIQVACPDGFFASDFECKVCPEGSFVTNQTCLPCPSGSFSNAQSTIECQICTNEQYQPEAGQTTCLACPPNADCSRSPTQFSCHKGFTVNPKLSNTTCSPCLIGYYKSTIGNQPCTKCPTGAEHCQGSTCLMPGNRPCTKQLQPLSDPTWDLLWQLSLLVLLPLLVFFIGFVYGYLDNLPSWMPLSDTNFPWSRSILPDRDGATTNTHYSKNSDMNSAHQTELDTLQGITVTV